MPEFLLNPNRHRRPSQTVTPPRRGTLPSGQKLTWTRRCYPRSSRRTRSSSPTQYAVRCAPDPQDTHVRQGTADSCRERWSALLWMLAGMMEGRQRLVVWLLFLGNSHDCVTYFLPVLDG